MKKYDCLVVGAGLAGLTTAYKLISSGKKVLLVEKESFLGGRSSSWNDKGMEVEAGFHRHIGFYKKLPGILKEVGVNLNDIIMWENSCEIKLDKDNSLVLGLAPFYAPLDFLRGILGNNKYLSFRDKLSLMKLFIVGFFDYKFNPKKLDKYSIYDYCKKLNITKNVIDIVIVSLSTGIFFLPSKEYSAKVFFGIFYPSIFRFYKLRIGAYKGGMTDVLANPIGSKFTSLGGEIKLNTKVDSLILDDNQVMGIRIGKDNIYSSSVVLASDVYNTKKLVKNIDNQFFKNIINIPTMSAITVQIECKKRVMPYDRATFVPNSIINSYTEESHSTFKDSKGRLSIILANPNYYMSFSDEDIFSLVVSDLEKYNILTKEDVIDYRVVRHDNKFYSLGFGNDYLRPSNKTPIKGLFLAGDYVRQEMYATMEGAVISGLNASHDVLDFLDKEKD